ncbi:MAG: nucleotidyl transferase AbiEii/AbiGii toxin family protein [Bacteroidales bacterium]|nr:nucleotidyl transferase AbiEii/AbiGii toxin family protein [Bacteroidales bacterium]
MVGGTAIALHLGHRRSIDFDLFCRNEINKKDIRKKLETVPFSIVRIFEDTDQLHFIINDIKVTFFNYAYDIEHPLSLEQNLSYPSLLSLASMKAYALGRRAKWKDYVDLYFILKDYYSVEEISNEAIRYFGQFYSEKLFREQLAFHKDIDYSEPVEYLITEPSQDEIKEFLTDKALDLGF